MSEQTGSRVPGAGTVLRSSRGEDIPEFLSEQERAQLAYLESIAAEEDAEVFRRIVADVRRRIRHR